MRPRTAAAIVCLALVCAGCGYDYAQDNADRSPADDAVSGPTFVPSVTQAPSGGSVEPTPRIVFVTPAPLGRPSYVLRIVDQNRKRTPGIHVRIDGKENATATTDADGEVRLSEPGSYSLRVLTGCYGGLLVSGGGTARVVLEPGFSKGAELRVHRVHRIGPSSTATADTGGDWIIGQPVALRFHTVDRCNGDRRARAASFAAYRYTSDTVEVEGTPPLRSDESGDVSLTVRCKRVGRASLVLRDREIPSESVDVVAAAQDLSGRHDCRRAQDFRR